MENIVLKTKHLYKSFNNRGLQQQVLKNLNLEIKKGDFTVIMGASGSGKSTLLYALSGLEKPTLGDIFFNEENISNYSNDRLAVFRRRNCGFIFQQIYLLNSMSVLDNCLVNGLLVNRNKRAVFNKARELFGLVGLAEINLDKFPYQLSGGEAQKAGIVRALMNDPSVVFADEPTGALNSTASREVLDLLTNVNNKGQSVLMVTHDIKSASRGNRILYLKDGMICSECMLDKYNKEDKSRQERLNAFLMKMGW